MQFIKNKYLIAFLLLTQIISSCKRNSSEFSITGKIKNFEKDSYICLAQLTRMDSELKDSCKITSDGQFKLKSAIENPSFFAVYQTKAEIIHLIVFPKDRITLEIDANNFSSDYIVQKSPESKRAQKLLKKQRETLDKILDLSIEYECIKGENNFEKNKARLDSIYETIFAEYKQFTSTFIYENPGSLASLMALYQNLGRRSVFTPKTDFYIFKLLDSTLVSKYPQAEPVIQLNRNVVAIKEQLRIEQERNTILGLGAKIPSIALPDTNNNMIHLDSILGNYILIDFWASWDLSSRRQNSELIKLYNKFNYKGFRIFQISLDKNRQAWKIAIGEDNMPWYNVSDLKFWNSLAVKIYKIDDLNTNFLVNPEGKIIAKDISVNELNKILIQEYYHKN